MPDLKSLNGPAQAPANGGAPSQLVILLHGLGSDGDDLIGLAPHWARVLPGAEFLAPHAPFACDRAPMGFQWFSLTDFSPREMAQGAEAAAPILNRFIDRALERTGLPPSRLALVGFSQGTMMALHVALRRSQPVGAVLGYSGALVGAERLQAELTARPPIMLIHGDADPVVPLAALHAALATLGAAGLSAQFHICPGLGHGIDPQGLALGGQFLQQTLIQAG